MLGRTLAGARTYGWLLAVGYGAAFIYGLLAVGEDWDFLNINGADNVLHLGHRAGRPGHRPDAGPHRGRQPPLILIPPAAPDHTEAGSRTVLGRRRPALCVFPSPSVGEQTGRAAGRRGRGTPVGTPRGSTMDDDPVLRALGADLERDDPGPGRPAQRLRGTAPSAPGRLDPARR